MIFQRKKVASALAYVLGVGGAATLIAVPAQAADIRVDVTGSNIKRIEGEGALPVQTITRGDIERQGIQTVEELVVRLSANSSIGGLSLSGAEGSTLTGYSAASLRGLGAPRTLVLLNGKRLANTAFSGAAVDINAIPLSAIERVEILTDGASAIYGTDAIAGVINFILRQDFTGFEGFAYYGDSEQGGGKEQRYNVAGGWGDLGRDKFNVFATFDYHKVDNIKASQRDFAKTTLIPNAPGGPYDKTSGNSIPGNVFIPGVGTRNPGNPACLPPFSFPGISASARLQCRFDYASVIDVVPPSENYEVFGSARWQFSPNHQAYVDALWQQNTATARVSPPPISSATILSGEDVLTIPSSPFYPHALAQQFGVDGQPLAVSWRGLELGPRTDENKTTQYRVVGGLQGNLAGWDYNAYVNWTKSKAEDKWVAGWSVGSTLLPILNSGQINLFGFNTPEAVALMKTALINQKVYSADSDMTEFNVTASNEIYKLPAGPLALALGATYRHEKYSLDVAPVVESGDVPGLGGANQSISDKTRNVWAVYAELNIPIVPTLEGNVAVRYDDYQSIGSTTNPKFSLRWTPTKELLVRGSAGTGFRAPSLVDLNQQVIGATGGTYDDPLRCPSTGSPRDCEAQFNSQQNGDPALKPERSRNWTVGFVFEPVPAFSFGIDYWWIKIKDVIGLPAETPIFSNMVASEAAGLIVRYAPGSPGCQNAQSPPLPCPVAFGVQRLSNLLELKTDGFDVNATFRMPPQPWGQLKIDFNGTYLMSWDQQSQGEETLHLAGIYGGGLAATVQGSGSTGGFPRWKHNAAATWTYGPWQATLNQLFVNSYQDDSSDGVIRDVGTYSVWGLQGRYTGFKNLELTLGVKNLFDKDPPFSRQTNSFQVGYDPSIADPTGRFYYASVKYAFK
jgi:iron complex outermembrane receptor protein